MPPGEVCSTPQRRPLVWPRIRSPSGIIQPGSLKRESSVEMSSTIAVVAEKPSVARDIAQVLGAGQRGEGCLQGNGYVVTWAIGHLVALAAAARDPAGVEALAPRAPAHAPARSGRWSSPSDTRAQFEVVRRVLNAPEGRARGLRHGRRARGRADLPLHLRGRRLPQAGAAACGSRRSPPTRSARASPGCATAATSTRWPTPPAAAAAPTGSWA